jgi:hypothetical protein
VSGLSRPDNGAGCIQGEAEPIADSRVSAAALVDWLPPLPVHLCLHREHQVGTHCAAKVVEGLHLVAGDLPNNLDKARGPAPAGVGADDGVAAEPESPRSEW